MSTRPDLPRRLPAEALGTFCLVVAGTGAVVVNAVAGDPLGHGGVAAAFGLVVAAMCRTRRPPRTSPFIENEEAAR